ncbi:uncharacterized protein LOC134856296 [Symsagittifera roscoffensis]|uniref:uncharacterized protein LOC134856296 n=1 Tax=Symsagittifera roscoffensis TaxID=84072 RepID=UPI00307CA9D1
MVGLILVPISAFIVRIDDGINVYCSNKNGIVENMVGVVGIPPILVVSVATLALLYIIHGRNKKSNNATDDKEVILALTGTSALYAVFGIISNGFIFFAYWMVDADSVNEHIVFMSIGQLVNTLGIISRSPILLLMKPMRDAFKRGLKLALGN